MVKKTRILQLSVVACDKSESVIGELVNHIKSLKNMCITETSSKVHGLSLSYPQIRDADPILQI